MDEMQQRIEDEKCMRRALELAACGRGRVEPNPCVGALIVRDGQVIAEAAHESFGGPHAEARVIQTAGSACRGATLYVTLEPCTGNNKKTPPCCDAVIAAGFGRVVIGAADPTREPSASVISSAGIAVTTGVLGDECRRLIAPFVKMNRSGMPWVIAKWAMTADGKISTASGESKWISSEASRELVHCWRSEVDAVMVGAGTVRRDDPLLTSRIEGGRNPKRIVVDSWASLLPVSRLATTVSESEVIVACSDFAPAESRRMLEESGITILECTGKDGRVDVAKLLKHLGSMKITNLMVEGGASLLGHLFDEKLVDEVRVFIAPAIFGGAAAPSAIGGVGVATPSNAVSLINPQWRSVGNDMLLVADVA